MVFKGKHLSASVVRIFSLRRLCKILQNDTKELTTKVKSAQGVLELYVILGLVNQWRHFLISIVINCKVQLL